ncbi:MAG: FG-GAP-like repeat-containing protein [Candidatus Omnitrophota bacterium]
MKNLNRNTCMLSIAVLLFLGGAGFPAQGQDYPSTLFGYGNGADGVLTVPTTSTYDLSVKGDGVAYEVYSLSLNTATLKDAPLTSTLKVGDEVMLIKITAQNRRWKNIGNYEFLRIKEMSGKKITFLTNLVKEYGNWGQTDGIENSQTVILQRVPNYKEVKGGGTITSSKYGLVVFRVQNTLNDIKINVDGKGFAPSVGSGGGQTADGDIYGGVNAGGNASTLSSIRKVGTQNDSTRAMALADIDNDGDMDLIVGNNSTSYGELTSVGGTGQLRTDPYYVGGQSIIYMNNLKQQSYSGQGKFTAGVKFLGTAQENVTSVAVGDFDNNGGIDIVMGCDGQENIVYYTDGRGNLLNFKDDMIGLVDHKSFGLGREHTQSVAVGDINNDTYLDIVVSNDGEQNLVYLNDGKGEFSDDRVISFGTGSDRTTCLVLVDWEKNGDYLGDGDLDIVAGNWEGQNAVYINENGHFNQALPFGSGNDKTACLTVGDVDNDGRPDIAAGNYGEQNYISFHERDGNNISTKIVNFGTGKDSTRSLVLYDINKDQKLDLIVGNDNGQRSIVYLNQGGTFPSNKYLYFSNANDKASSQTTCLLVADIDNDLISEVIVGNYNQMNYLLQPQIKAGSEYAPIIVDSDGTPMIEDMGHFGTGSDHINAIAMKDLNKDDNLDIVVGCEDGQNVVYYNNGLDYWGSFQSLGTNANNTEITNAVAIADVNKDGWDDIAVGKWVATKENDVTRHNVVIYLNDGKGNYGSNGYQLKKDILDVSEIGQTYALAFADVDKDGDMDLAVGNAGVCYVYLNSVEKYMNGLVTKPFPDVKIIGQEDDQIRSLSFGDVNGDGFPDLVTGNAKGVNSVYINQPEKDSNNNIIREGGNFRDTNKRIFGQGEVTNCVALADMDKDGDLDIVSAGQYIFIYLNDGKGNFVKSIPYNRYKDIQSLVLKDMNKDNFMDMVIGGKWSQNQTPSQIILTSVDSFGSVEFVPLLSFSSDDDDIHAIAVDDVDKDSDMDIVVGRRLNIINSESATSDNEIIKRNQFGSVYVTLNHYGQREVKAPEPDNADEFLYFNSYKLPTDTIVGGGGGANGADGLNGIWNFNHRKLITGGKNIVDLYPYSRELLLHKLFIGGGGGKGYNHNIDSSIDAKKIAGGAGGGIVCVFANKIGSSNIQISAIGGQSTNRYGGGGGGGSVLVIYHDDTSSTIGDLRFGGGKFTSNNVVWGGDGGDGIYYYQRDVDIPGFTTITPTNTPVPIFTPTNTPVPIIPPTNTPVIVVPPTNTPIPVIPPTNTPTNTPTIKPTNTPTIPPVYTPSINPIIGPFEFPISIKIGPSNFQLAFGKKEGATDKYDVGIDTLSPPADPSGREAYFLINDVAEKSKLWKDMRDVNTENMKWKLIITVPPNQEAVIQWNPASLPVLANVRLIAYLVPTDAQEIPTGKSMDMQKESLINIASQGGFVARKFYYQINFKVVTVESVTYNLIKGWNLISVPLSVDNNITPQIVFGVNTPIWTYNPQISQYEIPYKFETHKGYWIFVAQNSTYEIKGYRENNLPITLLPIWNLIGVNDEVLRSTEGIGVVWGYDNVAKKYIPIAPTDYLELQKGYWFQVNAPVTLFETPSGKVLGRGPVSKPASVQNPARIYVLNPSIGQAPLASLEMGRDAAAVDGIGIEDYLAPPAVPDSDGNAYFWTNTGIDYVNTVRDIRSMNGEQEWILEIDQKTKIPAAITWDTTSFSGVSKAELVELDPATQMPLAGAKTISMKSQNSLQLTAPTDPSGSSRYFKIVLSAETSITNWLDM